LLFVLWAACPSQRFLRSNPLRRNGNES
jgi:hypothetical protein